MRWPVMSTRSCCRLKREPGENPGQNPLLYYPISLLAAQKSGHCRKYPDGKAGPVTGLSQKTCHIVENFRALVELEPEHTMRFSCFHRL